MANKDINAGSEQGKSERSAADSAPREFLSEPSYAEQERLETESHAEDAHRRGPNFHMKAGATVPAVHQMRGDYAMTLSAGNGLDGCVERESNVLPELELQRAADRMVLARYGPPGLIIDERMNVLQSRGQSSRFMEIAPGAVSWSLQRILRDGLLSETRTAAQRAIRENVPATETALVFDEQNGETRVQIDVLPITSATARPRCFLVLFQTLPNGSARIVEPPASPQLAADEKDRLIAQLRQDLNSTRFHLQALLEERNARNQELVSANEEIRSSNAQLQSTNEDITLRHNAKLLMAKEKEALETEVEISARKLNRIQGELRRLTAHLFTVQEEERQHVARELHDDISQRLSLIEIALQELGVEGSGTEDLERLESIREQVQSLNTDVRQISHRLHPSILNDLGLSATLRAMVKEFGQRENMPVNYLTQNLPESWSPDAATAIYRIAQEALRNVAKHAGKTHVKVVLAGKDGSLQLRVMDFGVGFDQEAENPNRGLGMISMQERARLAGGTLTVHSELGQGTTVVANIPVVCHA